MRDDAVAWHDVECASYRADLPLWRELAAASPGPVLEVGCGTGRVALDLAAQEHEVTGLDSDRELVQELARRARQRRLHLDVMAADARSFSLPSRFGLVLAPMQLVQLLGGREGRAAFLACVRDALSQGGTLAVALADPFEAVPAGEALPPLPDVREEDGWVLLSRPLSVRAEPGAVVVERLRQAVSPEGDLSEQLAVVRLDELDPELLEREAGEVGLRPAGRRQVPETSDHVGSTVVLLS